MCLEKVGPKWIEINLNQYKRNVHLIKKDTLSSNVIPVLKANAYGHGVLNIAKTLESENFPLVAVATLEEAIELRKNLIKIEILILGVVPISEIQDLINYNIIPTICSYPFAKEYSNITQRFGAKAPYHFYIDTGMGRMGYTLEKSSEIHKKILSLDNLILKAVYSHFAVSDETDTDSHKFTLNQYHKLLAWSKENCSGTPLHFSNSGAILQHKNTTCHGVRPGLLSYGVSPNNNLPMIKGIKPIMTLKCRTLFVKRMFKGDSVSYGRDFVLKKDSNIATLPVGYADGVSRSISKSLTVSILGKRYPVVGRICMDMMMIDLGDDKLDLKTEIILMGDSATNIYDWSKQAGVIPYETLTHFGKRWTYLYKEDAAVVDIVKAT